ncbi:MAG TPA: acetyl-CoA carboxylase biotin carboxylase subunit [Candidatus Nanoarchaeia archaeon]|nr:acetyl-CoA carboxylase biotin carboxylase subunit [Candidatus Nanoarchaeia archaeon]
MNKRVGTVIDKALMPGVMLYRLLRKAVKSTKESIPELYDHIGGILRQHVVLFDKDKRFIDTIVNNIIRKLPTLGEKKLTKIISSGTKKGFFDTLNESLGATLGEQKEYTHIDRTKLFKRILIANRGEIALRIIRACKELGIESVVMYSKPEKETLFVKFADKAYCIGSPRDYLDIQKIIRLAKKAKADAIHPGYGYLSENSEFARLCGKSGIVFIGPSIRALSLMGNKIKARQVITDLGIPVIQGSTHPLIDTPDAIAFAKQLGYPVIIKASQGGGGKGMRVVRNESELAKAFSSAETEALNAFGDKSLYMEKYIEQPRHIEFQMLADRKGNVIHLGERDCSIQRRHQKLIEEAPSPIVTNAMRQEIGRAACRIAAQVGYKGAGTIEFLLDRKKNYYFMEMNARIQVEHGITEMITGVDLVKEQIRIAAGGKLDLEQKDIKFNGWAIECRINAEDPFRGFAPSTGKITSYLPPSGAGIRVSSHSYSGHVISHHYDPLIANLICGGKNRAEAILRMRQALDEYIIEGIATNIPFHKLVMHDPFFLKGKIDTHFIEEHKLVERLGKQTAVKKRLSKEERTLIITTAACKYLERQRKPVDNNWTRAGREESMQNEL